MTQCIAEPLSRQNIRNMAYFIRKIAGKEDDLYFDIVYFLDVMLPQIDPGFTLIIEEPSELGECHGLTYPDRNEIHIRSDVYERACNGSGRDRLTLAHELFHLLQHEKENISFARLRKGVKLKMYMDPEWQATVFGGELLVPWHLTKGMTATEIAKQCGVSIAAANTQIKYR